jgi:hypothetical protein
MKQGIPSNSTGMPPVPSDATTPGTFVDPQCVKELQDLHRQFLSASASLAVRTKELQERRAYLHECLVAAKRVIERDV